MWISWLICFIYDLDHWLYPWPWPWISKVKSWNCHIFGISDLIVKIQETGEFFGWVDIFCWLCVFTSLYMLGCSFGFHFIYTATIYEIAQFYITKTQKLCTLWFMIYYIRLKTITTQTSWKRNGAHRDRTIWPRVKRNVVDGCSIVRLKNE